jgi:hypothetical protein
MESFDDVTSLIDFYTETLEFFLRKTSQMFNCCRKLNRKIIFDPRNGGKPEEYQSRQRINFDINKINS